MSHPGTISTTISDHAIAPIEHIPPAEVTVAPSSLEEMALVLEACSTDRLPVLIWGGGNHQGIGGRVEPSVILSTSRLSRIIEWHADDLTLVTQGGVTVQQINEHLQGQSAILPEHTPSATVGGILASGAAGYNRLRMGPPRDHVLGITLITGDGRIVKAGGKVVKNVSGYDLMRLATGSLGGLGVIAEVALKLWPAPSAKGMVAVDDARAAGMAAYRPTAVLQTATESIVYLSGTLQELQAQASALGGPLSTGHRWPTLPAAAPVWSLRTPPDLLPEAVGRLPEGQPFIAQHLVGEVSFESPMTPEQVAELRAWAAGCGGSLIVTNRTGGIHYSIDAWGATPPGSAMQAQIRASFDPARILNAGRHAGDR